MKVGFEDGFDHPPECFLHHAVLHCGDPQWPFAAVIFVNLDTPDRTGLIRVGLQLNSAEPLDDLFLSST